MEEFQRPPEAPVFEPSEEEFADPIAYITAIKPIAEKTGICKIRPPPNWQPPFALDVDSFQFSTRIQQLNELEARSRVKLNFLDAMARFWELQGTHLKVPIVDKCNLDLHKLHKVVHEEGGFDKICTEKRWSYISRKMGYDPTHSHASVGSLLRSHYEKTILPYDLFVQRTVQKVQQDVLVEPRSCASDPDFKVRKSKRCQGESAKVCVSDDTMEMKKLLFKSPGPKMSQNGARATAPETRASKDEHHRVVPDIETIYCLMCRGGDAEEYLLLCDGCNAAYHTFCLIPPLVVIPVSEWLCPDCLAKECHIMQDEVFGFEQNEKLYTLESFGQMADRFKADYFNRPPHLVPVDEVEKTFWRLVTSLDDEVIVEYGADIHTALHGSGFPWKDRILSPEHEVYSKSPWNLNNLPNLPNSVLSQINVNISGMKVPWMYVGMCFSCFCWHIEDHWTYSINYLHWGEPKTWYGVPGGYAEEFEKVMKRTAPELFQGQPDLLHQLVTLLSPTVLMENDIPVVRTDQHAGEFMVTFPRAYHAGFNQGFNLAEAVNFAPADWLSFGRHCVENYKHLKRHSVFSHEELLCRMAATVENIDPEIAVKTAEELGVVLEQERTQRDQLKRKGIAFSEHESFELIPDDGRVCCVCNSTCFLSAVTSPAKPGKLVCLEHAENLCSGHWMDCCLRYRYTLEEMKSLKTYAERRSQKYLTWKESVESALDASPERRPRIDDLRELIGQASVYNLHCPDLIIEMQEAVVEADRCLTAIQRLIGRKRRKKMKAPVVTLEDLKEFVVQLENLACEIPEGQAVKDLIADVEDFKSQVDSALSQEAPNVELLQCLLADGNALNLPLAELDLLETELKLGQWLNDINVMFDSGEPIGVDTVEALLREATTISSHPGVSKAVVKLREILELSRGWESKAHAALQMKPYADASHFEALLQEAAQLPTQLPAVSLLKGALAKADRWVQEATRLQELKRHPWLLELEGLMTRGRSIPVLLKDMAHIESNLNAAKSWRDRVSKLFLKKNSVWNCLLEVLLPRVSVELDVRSRKQRDQIQWERIVGDGSRDVKEEIAQVVDAEATEWEEMKQFRERNHARRRSCDLTLTTVSHFDDLRQPFCVCKRNASPNMMECQLCKDWFHKKCVLASHSRGQSKLVDQAKFLCGGCVRSRRPKLDVVDVLVLNLEKFPLLMPEAIALQRLASRATEWQQRARQALALAKESLIRLAKESEQPVIDSGQKDSSCEKAETEGCDQTRMDETETDRTGESEVDVETVSPLSTDEMAQPAKLRDDLRAELEELMFEGDLLEVTLAETQQIWELLQSGHVKDKDSAFQSLLIGDERADLLVAAENSRKRRRSDSDTKKRRKRRLKKEPSPDLDNEDVDDDDDDDDHCAAFECLMPASEEVQWIQCDRCHQWYHFACVELTKEEAQALDTYVCSNCSCNIPV